MLLYRSNGRIQFGTVALLSIPAAFIGLQLLISGLIELIGRHRFANSNGLDGCGTLLGCSFFSTALTAQWLQLGGSLWRAPLFFLAVLLAQTLFCLFQLRMAGWRQGRKEFVQYGITIVGRKNPMLLQPLCVIPDSHYEQTDAYRGYTYYSLTLHTQDGQVLTNRYTLEEDWEQDREALVTLCPQIDLAFVCEVEPGVCQVLPVAGAWLPLMVAQKERLPQATHAFWMSLTRPKLGSNEERPVEKTLLAAHVAALGEGFSEERQTSRELQRNYKFMEAFAGRCHGNPYTMTMAQQDVFCRRADPEAPTLYVSWEDDILYYHLRPRENS